MNCEILFQNSAFKEKFKKGKDATIQNEKDAIIQKGKDVTIQKGKVATMQKGKSIGRRMPEKMLQYRRKKTL